MRYGIVQNHKFVLIDENLQRLKNTLLFMPQYSIDQIKSYENSEIEQCYDGNWYEKGRAPHKSLEEVRAEKLSILDKLFQLEYSNSHCQTSANFEINSDHTAIQNISNLIIFLEDSKQDSVSFCAYDNNFYEVTLSQLKTMRIEAINNIEKLYTKKWDLRKQIKMAKTVDEINNIQISFDK